MQEMATGTSTKSVATPVTAGGRVFFWTEQTGWERIFQRRGRVRRHVFEHYCRSRVLSGDRKCRFAQTSGEIEVSAGTTVRQVMNLSKRQHSSLYRRKSFISVASVVSKAAVNYTRLRCEEFARTAAVVGGALWKREWHCDGEKNSKPGETRKCKRESGQKNEGRKEEKREKEARQKDRDR